MDLYCPRRGCGEPIENDSLHDAVEDGLYPNYRAAAAAFRSEGCTAIGYVHSKGNDNDMRTLAMDAMYDLLGDDMDGAASMMDDLEYLGLLD